MKEFIIFNPDKYDISESKFISGNAVVLSKKIGKLLYIPKDKAQEMIDDIRFAIEGKNIVKFKGLKNE